MRGSECAKLRTCSDYTSVAVEITVLWKGNETFSSPASITLKMEAGYSVETSVGPMFQIT